MAAENLTMIDTSPIRTPWDELDSMIGGGLQRGRVYLVRGYGKTTAALNIAATAALQGYGTTLYEWEMFEPEIMRRIAASYYRTPIANVDTDMVTAVRQWPLRVASEYTNRIDVQVSDDLLVVDYLDYIPDFKTASNEVLRAMKRRAREHNIAVVVMVEYAAPDLYLDVDVVIRLKPIRLDNMDTGEVELHVQKNRLGLSDNGCTLPWYRSEHRIGRGPAIRSVAADS